VQHALELDEIVPRAPGRDEVVDRFVVVRVIE